MDMQRPDSHHPMIRGSSVKRLCLLIAVAFGSVAGTTWAQQSPPTPGSMGGASGLRPLGVGLQSEPADGLALGVRGSVLYSNNLDLQSSTATDPGHALLEVAPYARYRQNLQRGPVAVDYTLRAQVRDGSGDSFRLRSDLRAVADQRLVDQWLRVSALAYIRSVNLNPFVSSSLDPAGQVANTGQYRNLEISPYARGDLGGDGSWNVRYRLRYIDGGQTSVLPFVFAGPNTQNILSAGARSDLERRLLGVSVDLTRADVSYRNDLDYTNEEYDLLGWLRLSPSLRAGAGVGYSANDRLVNTAGESSGTGAVAALQWNPSARTSVAARWADRYYGNQFSVTADHRGANWVASINHSEGVQDGNSTNLSLTAIQNAALAELSRVGVDPATLRGLQGSPAALAAALADIGLQFSGALNTPLVYFQASRATVALQGSRSAVQFGIFTADRRSAITAIGATAPALRQFGANISGTYRLDSAQAINLSLSHLQSESASANVESTRNSLIGSWDWRLSPRWVVSIGARVQRQTGSGTGVVEFDEVAGFLAADYRLD